MRRYSKGLTLLELLVALTASLILVGGVATAFISVLRASDEAESIVRAHTSARSATQAIARDLRLLQLDSDPAYRQLILVDQPLASPDPREEVDGLDDGPGAGTQWTAPDDRHALIGGVVQERAPFVGVPDLGDANVDEDPGYSADEITFILPAGVMAAGSPRTRITYRIGEFDGERALLRATVVNPAPDGSGSPEVVEPVIFDPVSLDILAWNSNNNAVASPLAGQPYWQSTWNAAGIMLPSIVPSRAPAGVPPFRYPAAFMIRVTVNAERFPLSENPGWQLGATPLKTVAMTTIVNVESVIQDPLYDAWVRN